MIIVLVEVVVEEGAAASVRDALAKMEQASRAEEGCLTYAFSVDVTDGTRMRVTERWRSMEDLAAHMKTPHMAEFGAAVAQIQPSSMEVKAYELAGEVALPS